MRIDTIPGTFALAIIVAAVLHTSGAAQSAADPEQMFRDRCAACHGSTTASDTAASKAPSLVDMRKRAVQARGVMRLLDIRGGLMAPHARGWSDAEKQRVAEWIAGQPLTMDPDVPSRGKCTAASAPLLKPFQNAFWNGWGVDATNGRFQPARHAGLSAADISRLRLKWAFGLPNGASAYSQPSVAGGRVFVGSDTGVVYAIDASSGCFYWTFQADASVRTAPVVGESSRGQGALLYVGDLNANVYALDARSGALIWKRKTDADPVSKITGTPTLAGGRLFVPISAGNQEGGTSNPEVDCCTARGSVVALDADDGRVIWQSFTLPAAKEYGKTPKGARRLGPAGASVWVSPTVDLERGAVYVGTGNAFTPPVEDTTDAVLAFSVQDGRLLWKRQLFAGDLVGMPNAPDVDIGASVILRRLPDGGGVLIVGQKSGDVYALNPDNGDVRWKINVSKGGWFGGIQWGMAADSRHVYVPVSDYPINADPVRRSETAPSAEAGRLIALGLQDGHQVWMQEGILTCKGALYTCHPGKAAAISLTPDAVFAGSLDGHVRAYSTGDGRVLWDYDTSGEHDTVNGIRASGGSINGPGPTIAGGMVFVSSGYQLFGRPGNVLLAFGIK
jgi:polyvinyl alcohol dehydrogenase (cytochrome)